MSEISATISNFIDAAEKIYTLGMRIKDDLIKYSEKKAWKKIELELQNLRDLVGAVDSLITSVYVRLEITEDIDKPSMFQKHKDEFKMVFNNIERLSDQIYEAIETPYLHKYPELRQSLYRKQYTDGAPPIHSYWGHSDLYKSASESEYENNPPRGKYEDPWKDYVSFEYYLRRTHYITRETLDALNSHLEFKFGH